MYSMVSIANNTVDLEQIRFELCICRPDQFKPMLFEGQLCFLSVVGYMHIQRADLSSTWIFDCASVGHT